MPDPPRGHDLTNNLLRGDDQRYQSPLRPLLLSSPHKGQQADV